MKLQTIHWIDIRGLEPITDDGKIVGYAITAENAQELANQLSRAGLLTPTLPAPFCPTVRPDYHLNDPDLSDESNPSGPSDEPDPAVCPRSEVDGSPLPPPNPRLTLTPEPVSRTPQREAIRSMIGTVNSTMPTAAILTTIRMRMAGDPPSKIAAALSVPVTHIGGLMRMTRTHVDRLTVHPDRLWREIYFAELEYALGANQ